jgi:hypothetical protein
MSLPLLRADLSGRTSFMVTITILRALWLRRRVVIGVCVLAALVGAAVMFGTHRSQVGVATQRILVDTPDSQIVDLSPQDSGELGSQTLLLASLMADGPIKTLIAHDAGLQPDQIAGSSPSLTVSAPTAAPSVSTPKPYSLTSQIMTDAAGDDLPIIEVAIRAPTSAEAAKLAAAVVTGVQGYEASIASSEHIATGQRLQITGLAAPQVTTATQGTSSILAIIAALVVLVLGCVLVVAIPALASDWRDMSALERLERDELLIGQFGPLPHASPFDRRSLPSGDGDDLLPDDHEAEFGDGDLDDLSETLARDES